MYTFRALGVPVMDYTYDDCKLMTKAKEMNLPNANAIVEVQKLRNRLGLHQQNIEESIVNSPLKCSYDQITFYEFANILNLSRNDVNVHQLYKLYDKVSYTWNLIKFICYLS